MTNEITWRTNDLSLERCAGILMTTVAELEKRIRTPRYAATASCAAQGAWTANQREVYAAYVSLEKHAQAFERTFAETK